MPRPPKKRYVCGMPKSGCFMPGDLQTKKEDGIRMTVEEYETIRLIDLEDATQEECAAQMRIARTTVQGIYHDARKKIADALVNGKQLLITGGDYLLCEKFGKGCGGCGICSGRRCQEGECHENCGNL